MVRLVHAKLFPKAFFLHSLRCDLTVLLPVMNGSLFEEKYRGFIRGYETFPRGLSLLSTRSDLTFF